MPHDSENSDNSGNQPVRRGGGPPGGSAFLSSRLRQSAEDRQADDRRAKEEAFTDFDSAFSFDAMQEAAKTAAAPAAPAAPSGPAHEYNWDSTDFDEPVVAAATTAAPAETTARSASFPGGRVKLPRLGETPDNPDVTFVGTAFVRRPGDENTEQGANTTFEEYFTYESLFDQPIAEPLRTDSSLEGDDPYFVLGVDPEAPWKEIVGAHRALVKTHHPDRLIGASPAQLAHSEEALRLINRAYSELRRRGRDIEDEA